METAGKTLDDRELSEAMKDSGLGTPATRAEIIETLLRREYIVRQGKSLEATDKGIRLIEIVHPHVKSPAMTGQWEAQLQRIQRGAGGARGVHEGDRGVRARGRGEAHLPPLRRSPGSERNPCREALTSPASSPVPSHPPHRERREPERQWRSHGPSPHPPLYPSAAFSPSPGEGGREGTGEGAGG